MNPVRDSEKAKEIFRRHQQAPCYFRSNVDGRWMPEAPFRCKCGCNVFHKPDETRPEVYKCNACGQLYESE